GYGRVIRDARGRPVSIKEERDLQGPERQIREVNSGLYYMGREAAELVKKIRKNPLKGEYYLTDIVAMALRKDLSFDVIKMGHEEEFLGVNSKEELLQAQRVLRKRIVMELVEKDVIVIDEERLYVGPDVKVGPQTVLYPDVYIEGRTTLGANCIVYPNVRLLDCQVGDSVEIREFSVLENAVIENNAVVGPFARLRPGTVIDKGARIGNFVEIKNSTIGQGTKALHLSYIGDASVGRNVNIGAGTITCNYDGVKKHRTIIEDGVFVGSDTQLVAPVKVSRGAYIGAGTTVTKDVPPESLAVSRTPQKNIIGWAKKKRGRKP
ncbi:MAG: UDP-N-acetylglucosamine diphosphorylase/glucosamine-1-phosphate N-acetyltransferase, partial [Nitrospirae bacterium]